MDYQSKWIVKETTQIARATTLKPRLEYAAQLADEILQILVKKKFELNKNNIHLYEKAALSNHVSEELREQLNFELQISQGIESLRQVRRHIDFVFSLENMMLILAPTISMVRTVRAQMFGQFSGMDELLGELSLVLGGLIIDAGQLTGAKLDFEEANQNSSRLLDEAKLIADSKLCKQFPNVDLS